MGDYVGWDGTMGITLPIRTTNSNDIDFETGSALRMRILGLPGFVGIGSNLSTYTPSFNLDVQDQINLNFSGTYPITTTGIGYGIEGRIILQIPGILNTFVGVNAGSSWTSGQSNTCIGENAGQSITTANHNTFIGANAGSSHDVQQYNTYVGDWCGTNNTGDENSFFGHHCGFNAVGGQRNTFMGQHAGFGVTGSFGSYNTFIGHNAGQGYFNAESNAIVGAYAGENLFSGEENAFLGNLSGRFNTLGSQNTFIGFRAGQFNVDGFENTLIGFNTHALPSPPIFNASAIGARAGVMNSNSMILGNNDVNVGIGLSLDPTGPQNKLEINDNVNSGSGLRFRQLTSSSPASVLGVTRVLTVNNFGDVILGDIPGSGGAVGACSPGLSNLNYITKISAPNEICKTEGIYEMSSAPYTVGIGVGTSPNPWGASNFKMTLGGDLVLVPDFPNLVGGDIWMKDHSGAAPLRVVTMYGLGGSGTFALGPDAGSNSQFTSTSASGNVYIGKNVASLTANSINNTFIGYSCGNVYNDNAGENTFVGANSAGRFTTGTGNTFVGESAGGDGISGLISGNANTMIGCKTSNGGITTGDQNVFIGHGAYLTASSGNMNIFIGAGAHGLPPGGGTLSNSISLGTGNRVVSSNFIGMGFQVPLTIQEQQIGMGYQAPPTPTIMSGSKAKLYVNAYGTGRTAAFFNGDVYTNVTFIASDSALKDNVMPFTDAMNFLDHLEAKTYTFKQSQFPGLVLPDGNQIGFIAEEIEAIAPQLVKSFSSPPIYDEQGNIQAAQVDFKAVNYTGLIPVLFAAVKQQKSMLDSLTQIVSQCCSNTIPPGSGNRSSINLSNHASLILNQNVPNPFKDKTEITYSIPDNFSKAAIYFYDQSGRVINIFEITQTGPGTLTVFGDDLSSGIYTYTLISDGNPIQTKRMIKE